VLQQERAGSLDAIREKSLRIGVHHANAVVWGPVYLGFYVTRVRSFVRRSLHWFPYDPVGVVNANP
jgi:hypothetical protein